MQNTIRTYGLVIYCIWIGPTSNARIIASGCQGMLVRVKPTQIILEVGQLAFVIKYHVQSKDQRKLVKF